MQKVTYQKDSIERAISIVNSLPFTGMGTARLLSELADIFESGEVIAEQEKNQKE